MSDASEKVPRAMRRSRFWLIYAAAWLPYAASYVVVFMSHGALLRNALTATLYNVASAALLGVGVMWLCRRLTWPPRRPALFFAAHLAGALLYALLWWGAVTLFGSVVASIRYGEAVWMIFQGYALQWQFFSGLMIYGTITSVTYVWQVAVALRDEQTRAAEAEMRAARAESLRTRAELDALRAQLNPHFLFNTIHTLMALVRHDPAAAEDALERFAGLFRYVLDLQRARGDTTDDVTLAEELAFVRDYLALEKLRLGARLTVETQVDAEALGCPIPALTIQPLVENAVKHAVAPRAGGGTLRITARLGDDETLRLEVGDDGAGATAETLTATAGLGLRVVRERLAARYGGRAAFAIETSPGAGFVVRIDVPLDAPPMRIGAVSTSEAAVEEWEFAR